MGPKHLFRDLSIGDTFDFVGPSQNSFFERCTKVGPRCYEYATLHGIFRSRVGTINVQVHHVECGTASKPSDY